MADPNVLMVQLAAKDPKAAMDVAITQTLFAVPIRFTVVHNTPSVTSVLEPACAGESHILSIPVLDQNVDKPYRRM
jgi:hypothetical protein